MVITTSHVVNNVPIVESSVTIPVLTVYIILHSSALVIMAITTSHVVNNIPILESSVTITRWAVYNDFVSIMYCVPVHR